MRKGISLYLIFIAFFSFCGSFKDLKSPFTFKEDKQGIELLENEKPVFFYQKEPKSLTGKYICNNYIHPLYSIGGDTLTEEFPADHPYHRGIFWAWHQLYIDNQSAGDGWVMENIGQEVITAQTKVNKKIAQLNLDVLWKSKIFQNGKPFIHEHTTITVHKSQANIRMIDFEICLNALIPGVSIGGSDDEKGYGGFCARVKLPESLVFTSENGPVVPETLQIKAGPWMDFSASFGKYGEVSGLTILCHPSTPNYPATWILRQVTSMQNIVFPGRHRIKLPMDEHLVLRYRLIVHKGNANDVDIVKLQSEYNRFTGN